MATTKPLTEARILVLDDEPDLRTLYELALVRDGHRVTAAATLGEALQQLGEAQFDVAITDMRLPDGLGTQLLHWLREHERGERAVVITAHGSAENAVESLKAGAFDYLTKPVDVRQLRQVVAAAVHSARGLGAPERRHAAGAARHGGPNRRRTDSPGTPGEAALQRLAGRSAAMRAVKERIAKVARSMAPVLVIGESGTGKELVARALHANSHRFAGPFIAVNCSAIPESLLEAEFFGVRKGAFTGALEDREGFFQAARGGTLFLDEIGDLPLAMQSKLLRAIQERSVTAIGTRQEEPVDVRIVSATHRNLTAEVQAGRFRQDLFYRLNVIDLYIPPLRERREDLPDLCAALLERIAQESGMPVPALSDALLRQVAAASLPGNVRELENLLHRAVALSEDGELPPDLAGDATLPAPLTPPAEPAPAPGVPALAGEARSPADGEVPMPADLQAHLDQQEREILVKALRESAFNRTAAAARLGLSLRQMRYRIARLGIEVPHAGEGPDEAG